LIYSPPGLIRIVLTGGPGGGKTRLIEELGGDPGWAGRFAALSEATILTRRLGISVGEKLFQRVMVQLQMALEDGLQRALGAEDGRFILCDRGSLDPLAYWLARGWEQEEFFQYTATSLAEHYRRYAAVIHLVTTADGAEETYRYWPAAHRSETPEQAVRIDRLLQEAWGSHPCYYRLDNAGKNWAGKAENDRRIIEELLMVRARTGPGSWDY